MLKLSRAIDWLNAQVGKYAIWLILAATVISALNAVVRKIFNTSSNAFLEVQWYLFAWSFLIAAGFTLLHREHVRIDVINSRLSKRKQVWIDIIGFAFFLTPLCLTVLYLSDARGDPDVQVGRDVRQLGRADPLARVGLSLIHISEPTDQRGSRMPSSA